MKIVIKATHLSLTPTISKYCEEKISSLEKYFEQTTIARVELEMLVKRGTRENFRAEVNLDTPHKVIRAETRASDLYAAIDIVIPKLAVQIEKYKYKKTSRVKTARRNIKEQGL